MCNKAVDDFLPALKFIHNWLATSKIVKKRLTALYADGNIISFNEDSSDAIFSCNKLSILIIDLYNINLDNTNYDEDNPETIIHIRVLAW